MEPEATPAVPEVPDSDFDVEGSDAQEVTEAKPSAEEAKPVPVEEDDLEAAEEEPEEEAPEPEEEPKRANARLDARARVMKAANRVAEERELRLAAEARLAELEAQVKGTTPAAPTDEKPTPEQYQTYEEFVEALTDWKTEKKILQLQERDRQASAADTQGRRLEAQMDAYRERTQAVIETDPEALERIDPELQQLRPTFMLAPNETPGPENDVAQAIFESEHSMALMLHLSAHPEEMVRLGGLPDSFAVARAMGALEAKVTAAPGPRLVPPPAEAAPVSKAKPPVKPLSGSAQHAEEDVSDDMDFDDHMRIMTAKDRKAARNM